ncbi:MAG: glycosyltransferase family 4 protein [Planctomycetes bacterium]|nr:glycosyltransferase family 4 protein [Planctomycetota bacterium]
MTTPTTTKKVKILVLVTRLILGGAQQLIVETLRRIDRSRFEPVLAFGPETGSEGSLEGIAKDLGIKLVTIENLVRSPHPLKDLRAVAELRKLIRDFSPDIIHTHTSKAGLIGSVAGSIEKVRTIVYTPHGHIFGKDAQIDEVSDQSFAKRSAFYVLRRLAEHLSHKVVALNRLDLEEQVALRLAPRSKYTVIPNGVDCRKFSPMTRERRSEVRASLSIPENEFVIIIVGRLAGEKGHRDLFEAMKQLSASGIEFTLLVVGDGYLREQLQLAAKELGIEGRVKFLLLRTDVADLLGASDLAVAPSLYESYGMVIAEAMACGLPVIGSRVGGIPELIDDRVTGYLVDSRSPAQIADAIRNVMKSDDHFRSMGAKGRERVVSHFSIEKMVDMTTRLYERMTQRVS